MSVTARTWVIRLAYTIVVACQVISATFTSPTGYLCLLNRLPTIARSLFAMSKMHTYNSLFALSAGKRALCQGFVFCLLHDFTLSRTFIVDAAEMQNAMNDDTVEFLLVCLAEEFGI